MTGGDSTRFGSDKALASISETTFLLNQLQLLKTHCDRILISVKNYERLEEYRKHILNQWNLEKIPKGISFIVDSPDFNSRGPSKGIFSCLKVASTNLVLSIPIDMPFIKDIHLNYLRNLYERDEVRRYIEIISFMQNNGKVPYPFFAGKTQSILHFLNSMKTSLSVPLKRIYEKIPNQILIVPKIDGFLRNINRPISLEAPPSEVSFEVKKLILRHVNS